MLNRLVTVVGWVGVALVFIAAAFSVGTYVGAPGLDPAWQPYVRPLAWVGLACVLVYMAGQWREVAGAFERRQTRLGALALSGVLVALALLVALNYLASRRNYRWDLTANQQFSLSEQTRQVLQRLDSPVRVRVFDRPAEFDRFHDRLDEYAYQSDLVSVEYIDVDRQPVLATQNQVQAYGTVLFEYKGRTERVVSSDEQELSNALIKVLTGEERKVYFLSGHGERDTASTERDGYSTIASALGSENYAVESLVLLQRQDVPADASVVVVAGPETDLFPPEIEALRRYIERGGKLLVMLDPPDTAKEPPLSNLLAFLREWAIEVGDNVVVDVSGVGQLLGTDASVPVVAAYPAHPITEDFRLLTAYPLARSVSGVSGGVNGRTAQTFLQSSQNSWAETDLAGMFTSGQVENEPSEDLAGPVSLGAAVSIEAPNPPAPEGEQAQAGDEGTDAATEDDEAGAAATEGDGASEADIAEDSAAAPESADDEPAPKPETRLAVIGDSDFAANSTLGIQGNRDLFLNVVSWLSQQEDLISIRPRDPEDRRLTMTAAQQRFVTWFALLVIPAAVFGAGIYSWTRRRG